MTLPVWAGILTLLTVAVGYVIFEAIRGLIYWLHPCRRGRHSGAFEHRTVIYGAGKNFRTIVGNVEERHFCELCGVELRPWREVQQPGWIDPSQLTPDEIAMIQRGQRVVIVPDSGKLWE